MALLTRIVRKTSFSSSNVTCGSFLSPFFSLLVYLAQLVRAVGLFLSCDNFFMPEKKCDFRVSIGWAFKRDSS